MDRAELKERADKLWWFNAMDFGDFQTRGREKADAKTFNASLFGTFDLIKAIDVRGMRCIDIGAGSGVVALGLKHLGADYVAAVDDIRHKAFELATEISEQTVDYRAVPVEALRFEKDWLNSFDLVISSGLFYHLLSPFELVFAARRLLKPNGLMILQTAVYPDDKERAGMYLNTARNVNGDFTTFWVPGRTAVQCLLRAAVVNIAARREVHFPAPRIPFVAWLGRARAKPEDVEERGRHLRDAQEWALSLGRSFGGYDIREIIGGGEPSTIVHREISPELTFDGETHEVDFPYNPKAMINPVGRVKS